MEVPAEDRSNVLCEAQGIEHGQQVQQGSIVWVREPRLDGYGVV